MKITYNIKEASFNIKGNIKKEKQADMIFNFIRTQIRKGEDHRKPNEQDEYHITIRWFPENDDITIESDIGNKSVRDGILMHIFNKLEEN